MQVVAIMVRHGSEGMNPVNTCQGMHISAAIGFQITTLKKNALVVFDEVRN
jgi:hypothetical protein